MSGAGDIDTINDIINMTHTYTVPGFSIMTIGNFLQNCLPNVMCFPRDTTGAPPLPPVTWLPYNLLPGGLGPVCFCQSVVGDLVNSSLYLTCSLLANKSKK